MQVKVRSGSQIGGTLYRMWQLCMDNAGFTATLLTVGLPLQRQNGHTLEHSAAVLKTAYIHTRNIPIPKRSPTFTPRLTLTPTPTPTSAPVHTPTPTPAATPKPLHTNYTHPHSHPHLHPHPQLCTRPNPHSQPHLNPCTRNALTHTHTHAHTTRTPVVEPAEGLTMPWGAASEHTHDDLCPSLRVFLVPLGLAVSASCPFQGPAAAHRAQPTTKQTGQI